MEHKGNSLIIRILVVAFTLFTPTIFAGKSGALKPGNLALFPISGVTISKSKMNEFKNCEREYSKTPCSINNVYFYDVDSNDVVDSVYLTKLDSLPKEWLKQGLRWQIPYFDWIRIMKNSGYKIIDASRPYLRNASGKFFFVAEVQALSPRGDHLVELDFDDGNANFEGYSLFSSNSLYSISISSIKPEQYVQVNENRYYDWIEYECKNGMFGVKNSSGDTLTNCEFKSIEPVYNPIQMRFDEIFDCGNEDDSEHCKDSVNWVEPIGYKVMIAGKYGALDSSGKNIIPIQYDSLNWMRSWYRVSKGPLIGAISRNGRMILPVQYKEIAKSSTDVFIVKERNKFGVFDSLGRNLLPLEYDVIEAMHRGYKVKKAKKIEVLDSLWNSPIPHKFDEIKFDYPVYMTKSAGQYGVIDTFLTEVIPPMFDAVTKDYYGYTVKKNKLLGRFNLYGNEIIEPNYNTIVWDYPIYMVNMAGKYGIIDTSGNILVPCKFDSVVESYPGYKVRQGNSIGMFNNTGKELLPAIYDSIIRKYPGYWVLYQGKWGITDSNGIQIIDVKYDSIVKQYPGYLVKEDGKFGKLTSEGYVLIPTKYDQITADHPGYLVVDNGKYGKVNSTGQEIIKPKYDTILNISSGFYAKYHGRWGLFDKLGNEIIPSSYDEITKKYFGYIVERNSLKGLIDTSGKLIIPCQFERISSFEGLYFLAEFGDEEALFDLQGNLIAPLSKGAVGKYFGVKLEGDWSFSVDGLSQTVKISGDKIRNKGLNGKSGTLLLNVYLQNEEFDGENLSGYNIASSRFEPLEASHYYYDISKDLELSGNPPSGEYYVSITLSEYTDNGFVIRDYLNFPKMVSYDDHRTERILRELENGLNEANKSLEMINEYSGKKLGASKGTDYKKDNSRNNLLEMQKAFSKKQVESIKKHDKKKFEFYMNLYHRERSEADSYYRLYARSGDLDDLEKSKDCENRAAEYLEKANDWK